MAMIKCSECGADVSDKAAICLKCGNPINPNSQNFAQTAPNFAQNPAQNLNSAPQESPNSAAQNQQNAQESAPNSNSEKTTRTDIAAGVAGGLFTFWGIILLAIGIFYLAFLVAFFPIVGFDKMMEMGAWIPFVIILVVIVLFIGAKKLQRKLNKSGHPFLAGGLIGWLLSKDKK